MKKLNILSCDGGGMRGLSTCQILIALEERLNDRIATHIDFCSGSSTGGLITAMLLHPKKYTAQDISDMFEQYGSLIFKPNKLRALLSYVYGSKYSAKGIEEVLRHFMGHTTMQELTKPAIITAYDLERRNVKIFATTDKELVHLTDVCRSTSAAPTYFSPHTFKSLNGMRYTCADGGLIMNDPALAAYAECINNGHKTHDLNILSLGTGMTLKPIHADNYGDLQWAPKVIDILMSASSESNDFYLQQIFKASGVEDQYIRIEWEKFMKASPEMDLATPEQNKAAIELGRHIARTHYHTLDLVAERVMGR